MRVDDGLREVTDLLVLCAPQRDRVGVLRPGSATTAIATAASWCGTIMPMNIRSKPSDASGEADGEAALPPPTVAARSSSEIIAAEPVRRRRLVLFTT